MQVEFRDVRFEREGRRVLDIPALQLRSGATTAILGPNGSGKTTLLRLLAGLDRPQSGTIHLGERQVVAGRDVAYLFQEQVFLRRSVRENLELGLRMRGVSETNLRERIDEALGLLGITHLLERRADRLSGGEGRRVDLARALCLRAPLVLLDEPLDGLDRRTQSRLLDELPHLLAIFDTTTLIVTHSRDEAFRLADDLVVIVDGRVLAAGDKRIVATNPRLAAVADVLGYTVLVADGRTVAVPPRAWSLASDGWAMQVDHVLDMVEWQEVAGRIGTTSVRVAIEPGRRIPSPGDRVHVRAESFYELE